MKTGILNSLLAAFSLALCCLLAEVALRIIPQPKILRWEDRPKFYYLPKGSENLQGNTHSKIKPPGVFRMAVIGDSFTFAPFMQYDDSFPARLERMFNLNAVGSSSTRRLELLKYGVPGFSSAHEVPLVRKALEEGADLILLEVTLNDPERKPYRPQGITITQNAQGAYVVEKPHVGGSWLEQHSKLYGFLFGRVSVYKQGKGYDEYFNDLFKDPASVNEFQKALADMKKLCDEKSVPLLATIFPLFGSKLDENYPFHHIHLQVGEILSNLGIPFLDLESQYVGIPAERLQVMPGEDYHPNEIGHRIAAEALFCWLKKSQFVPAEFIPESLWKQRAQMQFPTQKQSDNLNQSSVCS